MKTRHLPFPAPDRSGSRPLAAVLVVALAAFGTIACSQRPSSPVALLATGGIGQTVAAWPASAGGDPSLPSATQILQSRKTEPGDAAEPAPTF